MATQVLSAGFFSLSDIRRGASLLDLNLPRPSAAASTFFFTCTASSLSQQQSLLSTNRAASTQHQHTAAVEQSFCARVHMTEVWYLLCQQGSPAAPHPRPPGHVTTHICEACGQCWVTQCQSAEISAICGQQLLKVGSRSLMKVLAQSLQSSHAHWSPLWVMF